MPTDLGPYAKGSALNVSLVREFTKYGLCSCKLIHMAQISATLVGFEKITSSPLMSSGLRKRPPHPLLAFAMEYPKNAIGRDPSS
jgi:hypothetical protein